MIAPESGVELSEPRRTSRTDVERAREDLTWRFADSDAAVGIRGNGFDGGGGKTWDEMACQRLHLTHLEPTHRQNMRRLIAVDRGLARLSDADYHVLAVGLSPRNWPWQSEKHAVNVRAAMQPRGWSQTSKIMVGGRIEDTINPCRGITVLGLVMVGEALFDLYVRRYRQKDKPDPTPTAIQLLRFVEREAEAGSSTLTKLRDIAEHRMAGPVERYAEIARVVRGEMVAERKARVAAAVARVPREGTAAA